MRYRKFRGRRICDGEWVEGFHQCTGVKHYIYDDTGYKHPVLPETVGMFSDLRDEYMREIFEGDVLVILKDGVTMTGVVIFKNGAFWYQEYYDGKPTETELLYRSLLDAVWSNIEGNIHSNKGILSGKN